MIVGVDPGKSGALALLVCPADQMATVPVGHLLDVMDMPVAGGIIVPGMIVDWMGQHFPVVSAAVIEDVGARPGQGVVSMFSFGRSLGVVEGVMAGIGSPLRYVRPQRWKGDLGLSADKGAARRRACELWPDRAGLFARVRDDGRAEAALIGWWWLHHGQSAGR